MTKKALDAIQDMARCIVEECDAENPSEDLIDDFAHGIVDTVVNGHPEEREEK
jgi:hypothetical protein